MEVRWVALHLVGVILLGGCDNGTKFQDQIDALASDDASIRSQAIEELVGAGEPAVPMLVSTLSSPVLEQRVGAAQSLARIGQAAVGPTLELVSSGSEVEMEMGVYTLSRMRPPPVEAIGEWLATSDNPDVEQQLLGILSELGSHAAAAVPGIVSRLQSDTATIRVASLEALGTIGIAHPAAVEGLIKLIDTDPEPLHLVLACAVLARYGTSAEAALPALERLADGEDQDLAAVARVARSVVQGAEAPSDWPFQ